MINGYTSLNVTKLDILDELDEIKVGVCYRDPSNAAISMPANLEDLAQVKVDYQVFPGWHSDTSGVSKYEDLPEQAKNYITFIEEQLGVPVAWCGVGPGRSSMLFKQIKAK